MTDLNYKLSSLLNEDIVLFVEEHPELDIENIIEVLNNMLDTYKQV